MRALVVGGSGQIGGWLLRHLAERGHEGIGTFATVPYPGLIPLDASETDSAREFVRSTAPDVLFYPAGFTWVDACERNSARAYAANVEQPLAVARVAAERGARVVYFSTDYVFDGRSGPNREEDEPNPLSVYGRSKLDAEHAFLREFQNSALIIRTSWVFGPERQGKNFAYQVVRSLRRGQTVVCPSDQSSSPTYGPDVALAAIRLAEMRVGDVIHVAGPETITRPRFGEAIAEAFGLDASGIATKPTAELGQEAQRPLQGGLATDRLAGFLPGAMRSLMPALEDFRNRVAAGEAWAAPMALA